MGSGREAHGKENPRKLYAVGLRTEPASLVRGSSRRITIMRFRPANIRVINRRNSRLDRDLRCLLGEEEEEKERKQFFVVDRSFHIRGLGFESPRAYHFPSVSCYLAANLSKVTFESNDWTPPTFSIASRCDCGITCA